jgi:molybdopterin-dependent oxidoreductase alpha subunit
MSENNIPKAQPPDDTSDIRINSAKDVAVGIPSVMTTMKRTFQEMGVFRTLGILQEVNQQDGFDCPGCAWPDPEERKHVEFCENGAKAVASEATKKKITPTFFSEWSITELSKQSDHWLNQQGRLTHPMFLSKGATHYEPISWDDAFKLVADELNALDSPDEAIFYTSGRTSNEAAFLYQLFVRQFGTNNLPDCSNMCHESSGVGLKETIGIGKGTVKLEDVETAEVIYIIGQNPGTNHPRMLSSLQKAKRNGCKIVSINPLPEAGLMRFKDPQEVSGLLGEGTQLTDIFLPVRINGDVALLKGIMKEVIADESNLDKDFIAQYTEGFDEFVESLNQISWEDITEQSGISRNEIKEAAKVFIESNRTVVCWCMGLTQHKNAIANIQEIVNLVLLRGQIGKAGAGLCPVRGHSNVQGDRTVGIWEQPTEEFLNNLKKVFDFEPPRHHGYSTVEAIKAMRDGRAKVFFAMGGNFLSATPDTEYTAEALRQTRLTAHVSTKLNRAHLITGEQALILPCLGRTEIDVQKSGLQFVSVENSMGIVHSSRGSLVPASENLLSEPAIVARLAHAVLSERTNINWEWLVADYDRVRDLIEQTIIGFDDYNKRIREPNGFYLPNGPRERKFPTATGKAHFTVHALPKHKLKPHQFMMTTIRSHDQFNTTVYGLEDRYRGISGGRRVVLLNEEDMREFGFTEGQHVDLISHFNGEQRIAKNFLVVPYKIPRRCAATYFPEANVLVPIDSFADKSKTPVSKSVIISIQPTK